jgi:diguanylate cyclase (GGDEF)-like protein/PAS domain S-box-containing protein
MIHKPIAHEELRAYAEARFSQDSASQHTAPDTKRTAEELLHELEVHQIELEIQNEELRRTQAELEETRDRYIDLFDFAPVGYFTLTASGLIAEANLTSTQLLRKERSRLLNRPFSRFVVPESRSLWQQRILSLQLDGGKRSCEIEMLRGDDTRFHARMECHFLSENKKLPQLRIAIIDITDRKHAEDELRIAAIAFETQEGMLVTDADGIIVRVNQAFTHLTGYTAAEAVGKPLSLLKSERHDDAFYRSLWSSLQQNKHWQGEIWNRRKNGKIYAEWLTILAVSEPDGSVAHYVGTISDITHNVEAEAEIHRLAYYDPLTQLPNRRLLLDRLGQALVASKRSSRFGALLFLDLDFFKSLNDTLGHDVGDQLLIEVAKRLHEAVRENDTLARMGGDEFVVTLEDLSVNADEAAVQCELVGEKIRESLAQPYQLGRHEFHGTTSLGVTLFHGQDASIDTLFKQADLALYQAKACGRNCLRFFDQTMQTALNERSELEVDLRQALKLGQLELYYHAQIDRNRHVVGAEALLRWMHPKRGEVAPEAFLPLAEETGLILPIGSWVLKSACQQLKSWSGNPATHDLTLAINISPRQFRDAHFVRQVEQVLAETGADPKRLKIELTERMVIDNVADTIQKMLVLNAIGIGFAMDDFGTGYSSLSDLKKLPLEQLKIDRVFIQELTSDRGNAAIVRTIITMGLSLGLKVIAEGVETEAQLEFLDHAACASFQGYLFSQPRPLEEFEKLVQFEESPFVQ